MDVKSTILRNKYRDEINDENNRINREVFRREKQQVKMMDETIKPPNKIETNIKFTILRYAELISQNIDLFAELFKSEVDRYLNLSDDDKFNFKGVQNIRVKLNEINSNILRYYNELARYVSSFIKLGYTSEKDLSELSFKLKETLNQPINEILTFLTNLDFTGESDFVIDEYRNEYNSYIDILNKISENLNINSLSLLKKQRFKKLPDIIDKSERGTEEFSSTSSTSSRPSDYSDIVRPEEGFERSSLISDIVTGEGKRRFNRFNKLNLTDAQKDFEDVQYDLFAKKMGKRFFK